MNKKILSEYIDACKLVEETEQEIKNIRKKKIPSMLGNVKGSNPEFPISPRIFTSQVQNLTMEMTGICADWKKH